MLPPAQLRVQKRLTKAFIAANPIDLVLIPRTVTETATGGRQKTAGAPRASQTMSLVEPSDSGYREPSVVAEGSQTNFDYLLIGEADAVIGENDVFVYEGREYKVMTIMHFNGYERRALVLRHGW